MLGDAYIGQPVIDYLKGMEVTPIRADVVDRKGSTEAECEGIKRR